MGKSASGRRRGILVLGATLAIAPACLSYADVEVEAREPADEIAAAGPAVVQESRLTVTANVPFDKAAALANRYQLSTRASGTVAGFISYDGALTLGKVKLDLSNDVEHPIRVDAPFSVKGTLGGKPLDQGGRATIDVAVRVKEDWCPIVEFGKIAVSLDDPGRAATVAPAGSNLSDFIATQFLSAQLEKWATCDNIKQAINKLWHPFSFAIDGISKNFINVDPRSIALSQLSVADRSLKFVIAIGGVSSVSSRTVRTAVKPLPSVKTPPTADVPGDLSLSITMNVGGL